MNPHTALDDLLESYSALLIEAYGINEEDMGDPSHTHQQSVYVVGRICPSLNVSSKNADATATGLPRLKPSTDGILIESSKLQGAGARVPVRFEKDCILRRPPGMEDEDEMARTSPAELLGIFPGMIVGLKGRNGGGDGFGCEEVLLVSVRLQSVLAAMILTSLLRLRNSFRPCISRRLLPLDYSSYSMGQHISAGFLSM